MVAKHLVHITTASDSTHKSHFNHLTDFASLCILVNYLCQTILYLLYMEKIGFFCIYCYFKNTEFRSRLKWRNCKWLKLNRKPNETKVFHLQFECWKSSVKYNFNWQSDERCIMHEWLNLFRSPWFLNISQLFPYFL